MMDLFIDFLKIASKPRLLDVLRDEREMTLSNG